MDPMMMAMMMGGGGGNMLPLLMMGGGGMNNSAIQQMLVMQMSKDAQKRQEKEAQNEQFDKIMQVMMMKMVGSSMDEKKPFDPTQSPIPYSIQEQFDENGRSKGRVYQPFLPGMGQQQGQSYKLKSISLVKKRLGYICNCRYSHQLVLY
jgi:hypothetical protein